MAAVIGAWRHIVGMWMTYDDTRTVTARARGSFHSVGSPTTRKNRPTAQPTSTLMMRLRNMRTASFTWGSEAAIIEAMAQIGLVSAMLASAYQTMVDAMNTLTANRIPMMSCPNLPSHFMCRPLGVGCIVRERHRRAISPAPQMSFSLLPAFVETCA